MTPNRFNELVKHRAAQRVKAKIAKFEATFAEACKELHPCLMANYYNKWSGGPTGKHMTALMRSLLSIKDTPGKPAGYPRALWADEEEKVQEELLATMDEMAKALLAEPDPEPQPIASDAPEGDSSYGI